MQRIVKSSLVCVAVLLAACSHKASVRPAGTGSEAAHPADSTVDAASVARSIRLCRTQLSDLQQQLGQPTRDGILHKQHIVSWTVQWDAPRRDLAVMLNAQNTVVDLYWNVSPDVAWNPVDQCLAP